MANKKQQNLKFAKQNKMITNLAKNIQTGIEDLYTKTYFSDPTNKNDLNHLKSNIDLSVDKIINNNLNITGSPNISTLYSRMELSRAQKDQKVIRELEDVFSDQSLMDSVMSQYSLNKYLKDFDNDIDTLCKYMPQLEEALDIKKDNVLSADHFSKDFLTVKSEIASENKDFSERVKEIKRNYKLLELCEEAYDNTARYGEQFIYIVPFEKALSRLLRNKQIGSAMNIMESSSIRSATIIESTVSLKDKKIIDNDSYNNSIELEYTTEIQSFRDIKIEIDKSGVLESAVKEHHRTTKIQNTSILESTFDFDRTVPDDEKLEGLKDTKTHDGLIDIKADNKSKIKVPGCIVKKLKRENVIPVYIEDTCLGYYYIEFGKNVDPFAEGSFSDPLYSTKAMSKNYMVQDDTSKKDEAIKFVSSQISQYIDTKFINANQDLRKEIYLILKHNEIFSDSTANNFKITFLPPGDVVHMYFEKDPDTHRGISDLQKSILPATFYSSLYITNTLGVITRGQDKRVYYIKQNIDTNISKTMMNTINQIKKSNFGAREITNMKYVLNVTGRFNDYYIPMSQSGDAPIQFEVMQGQNIEIKTELMQMLEQMAVNSTDVPFELIQLRQSVDYALQLTMTNSKFLRKVFKRQSKVEILFSDIINKIYNYEYNDNSQITVSLPPPSFLNITNTNTMIDNNESFVSKIIDMECNDNDDQLMRAIFRKKLSKYYLSTFLDFDAIETLKKQSENEFMKEKDKTKNLE